MIKKTVKKVKPEAEVKIFHKDMNLGDVAKKYPKAAEIMLEYGLHCVGCFANSFDTIEMGMKVHGYRSQEIKEMIKRLNREAVE